MADWLDVAANGSTTMLGVLAAFHLNRFLGARRRRRILEHTIGDLWVSLQANARAAQKIVLGLKAGVRLAQSNLEFELWDMNRAAVADQVHDRALRTGLSRVFQNLRWIDRAHEALLDRPLSDQDADSVETTIYERVQHLLEELPRLENAMRNFLQDERILKSAYNRARA